MSVKISAGFLSILFWTCQTTWSIRSESISIKEKWILKLSFKPGLTLTSFWATCLGLMKETNSLFVHAVESEKLLLKGWPIKQCSTSENSCWLVKLWFGCVSNYTLFLNCLFPLRQNECKIIHVKICFALYAFVFMQTYEQFCTIWTHFGTEAQVNSEMAYSVLE